MVSHRGLMRRPQRNRRSWALLAAALVLAAGFGFIAHGAAASRSSTTAGHVALIWPDAVQLTGEAVKRPCPRCQVERGEYVVLRCARGWYVERGCHVIYARPPIGDAS